VDQEVARSPERFLLGNFEPNPPHTCGIKPPIITADDPPKIDTRPTYGVGFLR